MDHADYQGDQRGPRPKLIVGFEHELWKGLVGYASALDGNEVEAYNLYCIARNTHTQPWTLNNEPFSKWWSNRIIIYDKAEADALKHQMDKQS